MHIRDFHRQDFSRVQEIFLQGIETENATFQTEPKTWEAWDQSYCQDCRLVLEHQGRVMGYAVVGPFSAMPAYRGLVEDSLYIDSAMQGQGAGHFLMAALIEATEKAGYWSLQAKIFPENEASIALHQKHGFRIIGTYDRPGKLNGKWRDVVLMERRSESV